MHRKLVQTRLRALSLVQVRYFAPIGFDAAQGGVARVYRELERDFGVLAPPIALHSPAPDLLAGAWLMLRETLLVPGRVPRAAKEAVAAAVSAGNACPFCVRMHVSTLRGMVPAGEAAAVADDRIDAISDPVVRSAAAWAKAGARRATAALHPAPFPRDQSPELIGVAVVLQYLNRMANVFLYEVPLPPGAPHSSLGPVLRLLTWLIRSAERTREGPGVSLDLLPSAPLPEDLAWASGNDAVAEAMSRAARSVDEAGSRSVPEDVRALVHRELGCWDGQAPGISRAWADDLAASLPVARRPAGRLALLTAIASYQVDEAVVGEFREGQPEDRALIELTAWASLTAARRVGGWMRTDDRV